VCPERVDAARHRPQQVPARFRVPPGPLFSEELLEDVLSKAVAEVVLWNATIYQL
jgi:hypothetical protein